MGGCQKYACTHATSVVLHYVTNLFCDISSLVECGINLRVIEEESNCAGVDVDTKILIYMYYTVQKCTRFYLTQVPEELEEGNRNLMSKDHFFHISKIKTVNLLFSPFSLLRFLGSATYFEISRVEPRITT
jgi:hypothetical protein